MLSACAPQSAGSATSTVVADSKHRSALKTTTTTTTPGTNVPAPVTAPVRATTTTAPPVASVPVSTDPRTPVVTAQQLIDDTHQMHEGGHYPYTAPYWGSYGGPSFSYVATHEYTQTPGPTDWVSNYAGGLAGMHPWYELTTEEGSPTNLDAKVEMSRIGLAVHRKSTNKWDLLYNTGSYIPQAWAWSDSSDYLPDVKTAAGDRVMGLGLGNFAQPVYEPSLGANGRWRAHGWSEAGWDNGRNYFHNDSSVAADVDAVEAWITVRVTGADAANSQYRIMPGFDVMKKGTDVPSPPAGSWPGFQGRARKVTPNWQTFTVSTMSNAMISSLPAPPIPGYASTAPAATPVTTPAAIAPVPTVPAAAGGTLDDAALTYSAGWTAGDGASNYLGTQHYTDLAGQTATATVSGSSIEIFGGKAHDMGRMTVSIDGAAPVTIDAYSATTQFDVSLGRITGLSAGSHSVTITSSATRNPSADGSYVSIDRITTA